jgi:hypothetical protein
MNILIDLLQPHSGISNEIEFETEENDMIAEKLKFFPRWMTKNGEKRKNGDVNLGF